MLIVNLTLRFLAGGSGASDCRKHRFVKRFSASHLLALCCRHETEKMVLAKWTRIMWRMFAEEYGNLLVLSGKQEL
jgi:hypothetical protein